VSAKAERFLDASGIENIDEPFAKLLVRLIRTHEAAEVWLEHYDDEKIEDLRRASDKEKAFVYILIAYGAYNGIKASSPVEWPSLSVEAFTKEETRTEAARLISMHFAKGSN